MWKIIFWHNFVHFFLWNFSIWNMDELQTSLQTWTTLYSFDDVDQSVRVLLPIAVFALSCAEEIYILQCAVSYCWKVALAIRVDLTAPKVDRCQMGSSSYNFHKFVILEKCIADFKAIFDSLQCWFYSFQIFTSNLIFNYLLNLINLVYT